MRYFRSVGFARAYRGLDPARQSRVDEALLKLEDLFEKGERPFGLGLKSLRHSLWEIRAGLADRIIFKRQGGTLELLIVGSHDEIKRFLKRL